MKPRELLGRLDRLQRSKGFKVVASAVVSVLALVAIIAYVVNVAAAAPAPGAAAPATEPQPGPPAGPDRAGAPAAPNPEALALDATRRVVDGILEAQKDPTSVVVAVLAVLALALAVIWLGLGLTAVGLLLAFAAVVYPLLLIEATRSWATLAAGVLVLSFAFTVLMRLLGLAFAGPGPVLAIARNVLAEAVRMKLSLVFIVLLVFALAALPMALNPDQPLRYRVQALLQYGTGIAFWIVAILVVLFSVATVCFEQRDKVIWQTMTKPVSPWRYVLGKWLGVSSLAAALLVVCSAGIFQFVEYLRLQPAQGEQTAFVTGEEGSLAEDRMILESMVLSARRSVRPDPPVFDEAQLRANVDARVEEEMARIATIDDSSAELRAQREQEIRRTLREDLLNSVMASNRSIAPGGVQRYRFTGLGEARESDRLIILRYKINTGSNAPDALYKLTFQFTGATAEVREAVLNQFHTIYLLPSAVDAEGRLEVAVFNVDVRSGDVNPETITFPPDGLEITYSAGGYRANYVRAVAVLWLKLAFLAMVGICTGTFLSFPVASLVSFTVFLAAEGSTFLLASLDNFSTEDHAGQTVYLKVAIAGLARVVAEAFRVYSELDPVGHLVEGRLLSWGAVSLGTLVLAAWSVLLFGAASYILSKRELATYSGS